MASKLTLTCVLAVFIIFYLFFYSRPFGFSETFELKTLLFILIILVIAFGLYLMKKLKEPVMLRVRR
jgi:hypothetical protein